WAGKGPAAKCRGSTPQLIFRAANVLPAVSISVLVLQVQPNAASIEGAVALTHAINSKLNASDDASSSLPCGNNLGAKRLLESRSRPSASANQP
ncbi:hypothetical protein LN449_02580, partial [Xanthomonas cannabis]|uniref:hypothetical protein n=1 Tax=Xanthomonas cannabis TaxID=1885674 RepID=UPI001E62D9D2